MSAKPKYELIPCDHFAWRIFRRDETWYADGRAQHNKIQSLGTKDKDEALRNLKLLDEKVAYNRGLIKRIRSARLGKELSIEEGCILYRNHYARSTVIGGVAKETAKRYWNSLQKFREWCKSQGVMTFNVIDDRMLERYVSHLENKSNKPKTIANDLFTLKQCIRYLKKEEELLDSPVIKIRPKRFESQKAYCYRDEEVQAMLQHCKAKPALNWLGNIVFVLAHTGLRIGELCNLMWSDIDFDLGDGVLHVRDESGDAIAGQVTRTTKSRRTRLVHLHPDLRLLLERLPRYHAHVLFDDQKRPLNSAYVRRRFEEAVITPLASRFSKPGDSSGFVRGRLHSFRHYFISFCIKNGTPENVVMKWVGHANSDMVRHYFQIHNEDAKTFMGKLCILPKSLGGPMKS
jgi:integrase